jgi:beta-phosphoglucomutase-like phosphatase (HAD superfamily)
MDDIKQKVKAIIFDMDGTIIKTEIAWRNANIELLRRKGVSEHHVSEAFFDSLSGMGLLNAVSAIKDQFGLVDSVENLVTEKKEIANMFLAQSIDFVEGFQTFHKKLQINNIPTSIATNSSLENLTVLIKKMNFDLFFGDNMYCVDHVGNKAKPDPALFLHAADKLGVSPAECIVFEDSLYGFQAANAAGMKCIAIKTPINKEHLSHVHYAISSYHEAEAALVSVIKK